MRSIGRVFLETAVLASVFSVLIGLAGGVIAIVGQPWDASLPGIAREGLALAIDPVVGVGIMAPAWILVALMVGLLTCHRSNAVRFAYAMLATVAITVLALGVALGSAAAEGGWAMLFIGIAVAVRLAFLVAAAVALALVYFVFFRTHHETLSRQPALALS